MVPVGPQRRIASAIASLRVMSFIDFLLMMGAADPKGHAPMRWGVLNTTGLLPIHHRRQLALGWQAALIAQYLIIGLRVPSTRGASRGFQTIVRSQVLHLHLPAGRRRNKSGDRDRPGEGAVGRADPRARSAGPPSQLDARNSRSRGPCDRQR